MAAATIFLDTNVFLYAAGGGHELREPCRRLLHRVGEGEVVATTSSEVVQEVLYVVARRGRTQEALALARAILDLFPDLLAVGRPEMTLACDLLERYTGLPVRDAVHTATMLTHDIGELRSADTHFDQVREIRRLSPDHA
jgi:predicted nucleic acid-binding protein